ncbi:ATP-binding protein [Acetobacteroides hydrogenigenes]|uniref:Serine/threonine-protein kinase RsbW n=1 Tax=Acetobacteroides hydrogenigenes TaxID=979970 RepID=A0A4V2RQP3_9BACT|nr:ATP-binding protein [Acetobacteroides hydrogenigenes]TCN72160.1 serine/threonine-protein kinase RsbW [Acetobacteroides hydrogenigenes]
MKIYKFESDPIILNDIEEIVVHFIKENDIPKALRYKIIVSSLEAITNSIYHGNCCNVQKKVQFGLERRSDRVVVIVEDEGDGFDYAKLPDPTTPDNIENPDGRGVFLMMKLSDYIEFNKKGNRVQLYFNI